MVRSPGVWIWRGSTREGFVELTAGGLTIGRIMVDYVVDDIRVSRKHLSLMLEGETVFACDGSSNGTFLNGKRMVRGEAIALKEGDVLSLVQILPFPPQAIRAEERGKLILGLVFHRDADEARRVAQATTAAAEPAATAAAAASSDEVAPAQEQEQQPEAAANAAAKVVAEVVAEQAEVVEIPRAARVSRACAAAPNPPPAARAPFTVLSPQQAGAPPSPPPVVKRACSKPSPALALGRTKRATAVDDDDEMGSDDSDEDAQFDDDVDDDDEDSEGEGLGRGAAARRDLGLSGSDEDEYAVELVVQARGRGSGRRYRVRWQGFTEDHDTWEPAEHLHPQLIAEFEREELAEQGGDQAAAAGDEAAEHQGGDGGLGGRERGGRGRSGGHGRGGSSGAQQHTLPPKLPRNAARLLASFTLDRDGHPDGVPVDECKRILASVRADAAALGPECSEALASYHKERYPTPENESYTSLLEVIQDQVERRACSALCVGISAAADGELGKLLLNSHPDLKIHQSDLRAGQAPDVHGIDADAHPLAVDGTRVACGGTDVALARNCFYNVYTTFLTMLSMCRVLRPDGVLAVACTRKQLGNVSTFLLEAERVGVLTAVQGRPIRLGRSGTDVCDAIHFAATRTGVQVEMIQRMPVLLGTTCDERGEGGQLARTMRAGLQVAIDREAVETCTGALPFRRGLLAHAYVSVAAGEASMRYTEVLNEKDKAALSATSKQIVGGAQLTLAGILLGLRPELGVLERFERLNAARREAYEAATNDPAKLAALRKEPAEIAELFGSPMVELLGGYGSTPCIYFAHDAHAGGFKVGDASGGVHMRYSGESGVTALPMVLTQTSLSAASKGGRPDTGGLRSFAREALETLFTVAIGGGLGKASSMFGSVATLGAKPGRTSASFKPGMAGATPAQLALKGAPRSSRLSKGQLEAATPAQLKTQKRKEREAASNLSCTRCNFKFRSQHGLNRHQSSAHPYCVPGCLRHRRDDRSLMIGCDACDGWYHPDCLGVVPPDAEVDDDTPWVCPACSGGG